jgi:hypothetical protein
MEEFARQNGGVTQFVGGDIDPWSGPTYHTRWIILEKYPCMLVVTHVETQNDKGLAKYHVHLICWSTMKGWNLDPRESGNILEMKHWDFTAHQGDQECQSLKAILAEIQGWMRTLTGTAWNHGSTQEVSIPDLPTKRD